MSSAIPRAGLTARAKILLPLFLVILLVASYFRVWRSDQEGPHKWRGKTMGTSYQVIVGQAKLDAGKRHEVGRTLKAELDRLESLMSTYRPDSELSALNKAPTGEPQTVSSDTMSVLVAARRIAEQTQGAFDVTVGPLVAAWGFGAGAQVQVPNRERLEILRTRVGWQKLELVEDRVTKTAAGLQLDLSSIAKGYASDQLTLLLGRLGFAHSMVEVGGEVRLQGEKSPGRPWRVGVEQPDERGRRPALVLELSDESLATSGDYRNYYETDGVRISHTIDPRSGEPVRHRLASVSVIHKSAMEADAYATALTVLGPEAAWSFAEQHGLDIFLIERTSAGGYRTRATPGFLARQRKRAEF